MGLGTTLSKDTTRSFQQETETPAGTQTIFIPLPSLEEPESFKGLSQEKGQGLYLCWGYYMLCFL